MSKWIRRTRKALGKPEFPGDPQRRAMWKAHPWCYYCKRELTFKQSTIDHKQPLSRGGDESARNKTIACVACNREKANMTQAEYWKFREAKKASA